MTRAKSFTILGSTIFYLAVWILAAWNPVDRFIWFLENLLIFAFFIVFIFLHRSYSFSVLSYLVITLYLTLHTIGAHYSYQTPIDPWLNQFFEHDRAYYDRVVHFSFGLLMIFPVKDWIKGLLPSITKQRIIFFVSILTIFSAGAFYELIEMWVANIVAPEEGITFVGIQGDEWDTQHDMALALYGSLISLGIYSLVKKIIKINAKKTKNIAQNNTSVM